MRSILKHGFCAGAVSLLIGGSLAVPNPANLKENYQSIKERNPFGLKDPVVPAPATNPVPVAPQPKNKIYLTGITSVGYPRIPKYVYLKTEEEGKKEPAYYSLQEEQSKDGITVLQIDEKNKKVKIRTSEGDRILSFATDGIAAPTGPAPLPGAQPGGGLPMPCQVGIPQPGMPQPVNAYNANQGVNMSGGNIQQGNYTANTVPSRIPSRNVRIRPGGQSGYNSAPAPALAPGAAPVQQEPAVDPAMQYLMLKAQEQHNMQRGEPTPPIPPLD